MHNSSDNGLHYQTEKRTSSALDTFSPKACTKCIAMPSTSLHSSHQPGASIFIATEDHITHTIISTFRSFRPHNRFWKVYYCTPREDSDLRLKPKRRHRPHHKQEMQVRRNNTQDLGMHQIRPGGRVLGFQMHDLALDRNRRNRLSQPLLHRQKTNFQSTRHIAPSNTHLPEILLFTFQNVDSRV